MKSKPQNALFLHVPLLLVLFCFTHQAVAKTAPPASSKKGKADVGTKKQKSSSTKSTQRAMSRKQVAKPAKSSKPIFSEKKVQKLTAQKKQASVIAYFRNKQAKKTVTRRATGHTYASLASAVSTHKGRKGELSHPVRALIVTRKGKRIVIYRPLVRYSRRFGMFAEKKKAQKIVSYRDRVAQDVAALSHEPEVELTVAPYSPDTAPFIVRVNEESLAYRINSVFAVPSETFTLSVDSSQKRSEYVIQTALAVTQTEPNTWSWQAPRGVGLYPIKILQPHGGATMQVNFFVMAPLSLLEGGLLNGYRVGNYPSEPYKQREAYTPPRGFVEVTEENENTSVSPHFRLRQFLCKQQSDYPKYIILDSRLLLVLETILQKVNERGHASNTLSIMSGYRTPYYNRAIGNATTYSRHLWGDAADIFIDAYPQDGEMDDLNSDGVVDIKDTEVLYDIVYDIYGAPAPRYLAGSFFNEPGMQRFFTNSALNLTNVQPLMTGGLARYQETGSHGPFVHVDVRGVFTRWGR